VTSRLPVPCLCQETNSPAAPGPGETYGRPFVRVLAPQDSRTRQLYGTDGLDHAAQAECRGPANLFVHHVGGGMMQCGEPLGVD